MIVYKPGQSLGSRSLGGILRARWDDEREIICRMIAKRNLRGVPLDDGDGALYDPGEYAGDDELDAIKVTVRALSLAKVQECEAALTAGAKAIADKDVDGFAKESSAVRNVLDMALVDVTGLVDGATPYAVRTPLSDDVYDVLGGNRLLAPVLSACMWLQTVRGEQRKNSGASQPQSYRSSTATHVLMIDERTEGATMTPPPAGGIA